MEQHSGDRALEASEEIVYCFDFDGVLCDSMNESLVTSYTRKPEPGSFKLIQSLGELA